MQPNQSALFPSLFTPNFTPSSLANNPGSGSINQSNLNNSFSGSDLGTPQLNVRSCPQPDNRASFLTGYNSDAARNLFAPSNQPQQISLFGPPSHPVSRDNSKSGGRKAKNTVRIS
jgi:hypothetical protein